MIINGENLILGRLATFAAKQALLKEEVKIVNCEKVIITGTRKNVFEKYKLRQSPGDVVHAPIVYRMSNMLVRRTIRNMLPWKKTRGREAYKKIFCYIGIPSDLKDEKMISLEKASVNKLKNLKYVPIKDVSAYLGQTIK